jgi:hypothetical protein
MKHMRTKVFFLAGLIAMFAASSVQAQQTAIGLRGGLTIPNLTSGSGSDVNPLNEGYSSRLGAGFGVFADFKISKLFSLQPMLEYSQQGGKKNGFQAFPVPDQLKPMFGDQAPDYLYADFKSTAKLNYLMLPVLAKFGWDIDKAKKWRLYVDAGPFAGLLLDAHQVTSGNSNVYMDAGKTQPIPNNPQDPSQGLLTLPFDNTQNIKDQLHHFNFGIEANAGIAYKMKQHAVFIEGGGNYGLVNIQKGSANGKNNSGAATVMIGYAYTL